jgi:hypothetical protein
MTALASIALATAAGYKLEESATADGQRLAKLSKIKTGLQGAPSRSRAVFIATTTTAALAGVLAALNGERYYRYGQSATINKDKDGVTGTVDVS